MQQQETNLDGARALALSALAWVLGEARRAERLLALTGLGPEDLRSGLGRDDVLAAVLAFLEGHEPDLVACAQALEVEPSALVTTRGRLEQ